MKALFSITAKKLAGAIIATTTAAAARFCQNGGGLRQSPWSTSQLRFARFTGIDVKPGNVIQRKGKTYEVVKANHTTQGRGGAIIQVELRDIDSGNKVNERLRTDEAVEKVFVQDKSYTYLYTDNESGCVVLMEPETYDQIDVPKHMFGEGLPYLTDDMNVSVQFLDGRPTSAKVPQRVTCTVAEAHVHVKGSTAQPQYKKVLLDNGLTVQVPSYILAGEKIIINTTEHYYMSRDFVRLPSAILY
ncbi:translation elongation factor [Lithospermum erythrorhizon]|uniref:Translation elongation factor n=1 Tax=Lithospermum erythrorhizon TaxID=34254 RepID=A0AAV3RKI3_LITER